MAMYILNQQLKSVLRSLDLLSSMANTCAQLDLVFFTCANGHVAQHVGDQLLALPAAPRVRATVRSVGTTAIITQFSGDKPDVEGRFEFVVVPYIVVPGSFDEAVKGAHHRIDLRDGFRRHIASSLLIFPKNVAEDLLKARNAGHRQCAPVCLDQLFGKGGRHYRLVRHHLRPRAR